MPSKYYISTMPKNVSPALTLLLIFRAVHSIAKSTSPLRCLIGISNITYPKLSSWCSSWKVVYHSLLQLNWWQYHPYGYSDQKHWSHPCLSLSLPLSISLSLSPSLLLSPPPPSVSPPTHTHTHTTSNSFCLCKPISHCSHHASLLTPLECTCPSCLGPHNCSYL